MHGSYPSIEAAYPLVDIPQCTLRRALNLTLAWLLSVVSQEDWESDYKPILSKSFEDFANEREAQSRWAEPDEEGRGEFVLVREDLQGPRSINFKTAEKPAPA